MTKQSTAMGRARVEALPLRRISRKSGLFRGFGSSMSDIWAHRELVLLFTRREIKARYSDTSVGLLWSLVRPLAQLLVYYFALGEILGAARGIPSFALFIFLGLTGWTYYTEIISRSTASIVQNQGLVKKVYVPREVFPLSSLGAALFNLLVQMIIFAVATVLFGQIPTVRGLVWALLGLIVLTVWGLALGMLFAAVNVYFRDMEHMVEVILIICFWLSPIVYSYYFVNQKLGDGWLDTLYMANPATVGIITMQRGLWVAGLEDAQPFPPHLLASAGIMIAIGLLFLWLSHRFFARLQGNFAQEF